MITRHNYNQIRFTLLAAIRNIVRYRDLGLCSNIFEALECDTRSEDDVERHVQGFLEDCFVSWPEFSGNLEYPVPGGERAYNSMFLDKYGDTPYGLARCRLASHILSRLEGVYGNAFGN